MMRNGKIICWIVVLMLGFSGLALAQEDQKGCKDHPLFTRIEGYYLWTCQVKEFDAFDFIDPATKQKVTIEGRKIYTGYSVKKGFKGKYSYIQVSRNYTNAIERLGGTFWVNDPRTPFKTSMKLLKDDKEIWAYIHIDTDADNFHLTIVEKQAMTQEIVADAKTMAADISTSGRVSIYGIYFDFNKADIKPESETALHEITTMLQQDPKLKVYVVGHTDNIGGYDYNMKLSQERAEAVVKELVLKYKIAPDRLKAAGVGPLVPVTSNDTEDGKAKNRRVELVKQ
ncbi:MAG: OmpA family protein [Desulfosoma sp.]|uniref:OmpA family protein n=1 Tax=Desulfosoma sp. TaxID=2603217 RepID=UPI00404956E0